MATNIIEFIISEGTKACLATLTDANNIISVAVARKAYENGIAALLSTAKTKSAASAVRRPDYDDALLKIIGTLDLTPYDEYVHTKIVCNMQILQVSLNFADMDVFTEMWRRQLGQLNIATTGGQQQSLSATALADVDPDALARVTRQALAEAEKRLVIRDDPDAHQGTIRNLRQGALDVEKRIQANDKKLLSDRLAAAIKHAESKNQDPPQGRLLPPQTHAQGEDAADGTPPSAPKSAKLSAPDAKKAPKRPKRPKEPKPLPPLAGPAPFPGDNLYHCDGCPEGGGYSDYSSFTRHFRDIHHLGHPEARGRADVLYPVRFPAKKKNKSTVEATTTAAAAEWQAAQKATKKPRK